MDSQSPNRSGNRLLIPFLSLACFATACSGDKRQVIHGTVSLDDAPLSSGVVQFHGPAERLVTAVIQSDGTFTATDLPRGEVKVAVVEDIMALPKGKGDKAGAKRAQVPAKYKSAPASGLSYIITPSTRNLEIKLRTSG
jgi:hypothetical protein